MIVAAVTALDVALAAAIASPLAAIAIASGTHRHERRLRLYDEKRAAYVGALVTVMRRVREFSDATNILTRGADLSTNLLERYNTDAFFETQAITNTFLSPAATAALNDAYALFAKMDGVMLVALHDPAARAALPEAVAELQRAVTEPFGRLRQAAKHELGVH